MALFLEIYRPFPRNLRILIFGLFFLFTGFFPSIHPPRIVLGCSTPPVSPGIQGSTPLRSKGHPKKHLPLFDRLLLPLPFHKLPVIEAISLNSLSANANEFSAMFDVCYASDKLSPRRHLQPAKVHLKPLLSSSAAKAAHTLTFLWISQMV